MSFWSKFYKKEDVRSDILFFLLCVIKEKGDCSFCTNLNADPPSPSYGKNVPGNFAGVFLCVYTPLCISNTSEQQGEKRGGNVAKKRDFRERKAYIDDFILWRQMKHKM